MKITPLCAAVLLLFSAVAGRSDTLFVADSGDNSVVRIGPSGIATEYASAALVGPVAVAIDGNRNLYVANSNGSVTGFAPGSNEPVTLVSGLGSLGGIAIGPDGFAYVSVTATKQILKVVAGAAGTALFSTVNAATGVGSIVFDASGTLYVADPAGNSIFQVNSGGAPTLFSNDVTGPRAVRSIAQESWLPWIP